ncbi:hypothetical protein HHI36_012253 [Cryptolaemus montrouzieri]|uniref:Serpin domain-containing protein n=1 Tax=Cryptolaemus montrouzieri TaxID=559131 RepID=A0ABD2NEX2_9CUCU
MWNLINSKKTTNYKAESLISVDEFSYHFINVPNEIAEIMKLLGILTLTLCSVFADDAIEELQKGAVEFSASLYQKAIKDQEGANVILSPLSAQIVLALAQLGAKGETALELTKGLHLPDTPENLDSANKIYLKDGYTINPDFLKLSQEVFDASLENINFAEAAKAAQTINSWVESKTNDKIKNLIDPSALDDLTRLVLVNAVYFKANWSSPFDAYGTSKRKFYKSEKEEIDVDTMHVTDTFKYVENKKLDAKFLELPYEGGDVVMRIIVPNKKEGLTALEGQLSEVLQPQQYNSQSVSLFMPKFKIESTFKLIPALKELGIEKAFEGGKADFSGFLVNPEPLVISDVIQKAFINVTESGTEAAAATAVFIVAPSVPGAPVWPITLEVNRPFLYSICTSSGDPIFLGRVTSPSFF